ncbi:uncharacterized protein UTRI_02693 [Ustilago trichophora]|uniref:Uncharacterized protein n=1 Tax=Ustilago trichophora TaxID=86804 RepID=A0A5C3EQT4_9BASI|nr:uncharacterized protein UTRI_02693 [Ustilago trichophora]
MAANAGKHMCLSESDHASLFPTVSSSHSFHLASGEWATQALTISRSCIAGSAETVPPRRPWWWCKMVREKATASVAGFPLQIIPTHCIWSVGQHNAAELSSITDNKTLQPLSAVEIGINAVLKVDLKKSKGGVQLRALIAICGL